MQSLCLEHVCDGLQSGDEMRIRPDTSWNGTPETEDHDTEMEDADLRPQPETEAPCPTLDLQSELAREHAGHDHVHPTQDEKEVLQEFTVRN